MAEVLVTKVFRYIGVSTDTKTTAGVPAGSTWYETDTLARFLYSGSAWVVQR